MFEIILKYQTDCKLLYLGKFEDTLRLLKSHLKFRRGDRDYRDLNEKKREKKQVSSFNLTGV